MAEDIPAMAVTVEVDGGPTLRLSYDGAWQGGPIVPFTRIMLKGQARPTGPGYLFDLLVDAASLLALYATAQQHWPADLRPAGVRAERTDDHEL